MKTFKERQQIRQAKRAKHQKEENALMHKVGARSQDWSNHKYSIERKIKKLGRVSLKDVKIAL